MLKKLLPLFTLIIPMLAYGEICSIKQPDGTVETSNIDEICNEHKLETNIDNAFKFLSYVRKKPSQPTVIEIAPEQQALIKTAIQSTLKKPQKARFEWREHGLQHDEGHISYCGKVNHKAFKADLIKYAKWWKAENLHIGKRVKCPY